MKLSYALARLEMAVQISVPAAFAAVLLGVSPALGQDDECSVEMRSIVDVQSPKVEKVIFSGRRPHRGTFEQVFNLKGGITASFEIVGCNEYYVTFTFRPIPGLTAATPPDELIKIGRTMLQAVPVNKADEHYVHGVKEALRRRDLVKETSPAESGISFDCGAAKCTIAVPNPRLLEFQIFLGGIS